MGQPCICDWLMWQDVDLDAHLTRLLRTYYGVGRVSADSMEVPPLEPEPVRVTDEKARGART